MKVCLLNDSFPPMIDGVVNVLMNYADYMMQDYNAEIMVGTPEYPGTDYSIYPYPVVAYPSFDTTAVTNGYRAGNPLCREGCLGTGSIYARHYPFALSFDGYRGSKADQGTDRGSDHFYLSHQV